MKRFTWTLALLVGATSASEPPGISTKGVALIKREGGAAFTIQLQRGNQIAEVPSDFEFRSGDKFRIRLNVTGGRRYVYVLNRTLQGDARALETTRDLRLELQERSAPVPGGLQPASHGRVTTSDYVLVYPAKGHQIIPAGWVTIPTSGMFGMDQQPGMEKLYVVFSGRPLTQFAALLDGAGGPSQAPPRQSPPQVAKVQRQQEIDVQLTSMLRNSEVAAPPVATRGVEFVPAPPSAAAPQKTSARPSPKPNAGVVAPISAAKPYVVELSLLHR
ncbi:MAG: hypothetical protein JNK87_40425 [Bryobacterales bacterium]|nr:hypothetical protein [Bryobacterales bacterium]